MSDVVVLAYFPDDLTRVYQLAQWLPVLELLDDDLAVGVVTRDPAVAESCRRAHEASRPPGTDVRRADGALRRARRQARALLQQLAAQLRVAGRPADAARARQPRRERQAEHGEQQRQGLRPGVRRRRRLPSSGTGPACMEFDPARLVRVGRPPARPAPRAAARRERAPDRAVRTHLGGGRRLQLLHQRRRLRSRDRRLDPRRPATYAWSTSRTRRSPPAPARHPRRAPRDPGHDRRGRRPRARRRPHGRPERRHPRRDARAATPSSPTSPRSASTGSTCRRTSPSCSPTGTTTRTGSARTCR